jgi:hypothetical protein
MIPPHQRAVLAVMHRIAVAIVMATSAATAAAAAAGWVVVWQVPRPLRLAAVTTRAVLSSTLTA